MLPSCLLDYISSLAMDGSYDVPKVVTSFGSNNS
jgi:hypothetical protein